MQFLGIFTSVIVIAVGFMERGDSGGQSYFDWHAAFIILFGSFGAVFLASGPKDFIKTLAYLKEFIPGLKSYEKTNQQIEVERKKIELMWLEGKRAEIIQFSESSNLSSTKTMIDQLLSKSNKAYSENRFTALSHDCLDEIEPVVLNWELLGKLGPSFGIVGTITAMINIFAQFGGDQSKIGASMSLALLATLYGITFGSAVAGPIGNYFSKIMEDRLNAYDRCWKTTRQLIDMDS